MARRAPGPVEVTLSQPNLQVYCQIVYEDKTVEEPFLRALMMRGAQREVTAMLADLGYEPAGRWATNGKVSRRPYRPTR